MEEKPKEEHGKRRRRRSRRKKEKEKNYNFSDTPDWVVTANKWLFVTIFFLGVILPWAVHYYLTNYYYR